MKRIVILLGMDSIAFFLSLMGTYFVFSTFQFNSISLLLLKAYSQVIIFLWLLFLVTINFGGLYNSRKHIYSSSRILLVSCIYLIELLCVSYIYPKYALSRALLLNNFLFLYLCLNGLRLMMSKFVERFL